MRAKNGSPMSGTATPMAASRPVRKLTASMLGTYCNSSTDALPRCRALSETYWSLRSTRETVLALTPARSATSRIVAMAHLLERRQDRLGDRCWAEKGVDRDVWPVWRAEVEARRPLRSELGEVAYGAAPLDTVQHLFRGDAQPHHGRSRTDLADAALQLVPGPDVAPFGREGRHEDRAEAGCEVVLGEADEGLVPCGARKPGQSWVVEVVGSVHLSDHRRERGRRGVEVEQSSAKPASDQRADRRLARARCSTDHQRPWPRDGLVSRVRSMRHGGAPACMSTATPGMCRSRVGGRASLIPHGGVCHR